MSIVNSNQLTTVPNPTNLTDSIEAIKALTENQETLRKFGYGRDEASFKVLAEITVNNKILSRLDKGTTAIVTVDNSSSAITIKLPAVSDTFDGDSYFIFDKRGSANTHNITLDLNSNELDGGTTNPIININKGFFQVVCIEQGKFITILDSKKQVDLTLTGVIKGNGTILSGNSTINDLGSQTADYSANNKALKNLSNLIIGSNTVGSYSVDVKNSTYISSISGTATGAINLEGSYTASYFNSIDFAYNTGAVPSVRYAAQFTSGGSFGWLCTSNSYGSGITHIPVGFGFFTTEALAGIKVIDNILFANNNVGQIGTSTSAPANIYSVNAVTVTSDNDFKTDINKNIPLGLDFVKKVADTAIATYRWQDTMIPEKKIIEFKKDSEGNYITETKVLEPEKIEKHNRKHFGFLGVELYQAIIESGLDTKECAFLSVDDPNQNSKIEINAITGEKKETSKKDFEVKIKDGRPDGKITIKPTEMIPILFKAITELSERIELLEQKG